MLKGSHVPNTRITGCQHITVRRCYLAKIERNLCVAVVTVVTGGDDDGGTDTKRNSR